jgi:hypothetical protein
VFEKLLLIFCYFNYHPKTKLVEVKIGFGPSGKTEKVECKVCHKIFIRDNQDNNLKIILLVILAFVLLLLLF